MSFSFWARAPRGVGLGDVLAPALRAGASTVEDDVGAAEYTHVYLPGVSTRGVEVYREDQDVVVRLLTCSAPGEYALGVFLARTAAELSGTEVRSEHGWQGAPASVQDEYGAAWIAGEVASGARIALTLADERGPLTMGGPVRNFHLGARLAAELRAAGPEDGLADRLLAAVRRAQWPGDRYYSATTMRLTGKSSGNSVSFAVWSPVACVLPDVEVVVMHGDNLDTTVPVALDSVPLIAGPLCTRLDERQLLLEPVPDEDWPAMRTAAGRYRVELPP